MVTIYFFYGLSFFALGIALLVRDVPAGIASLRPSLNCFALFALLHASQEWLLMSRLNGVLPGIGALDDWIEVTGGLSYFALLAAGLLSFPTAQRPPRHIIVLVPAVLAAVWLALLVTDDASGTESFHAEVFARFLVGGPGGLLLGVGLLLQGKSRRTSAAFAALPKRSVSTLSIGFFGSGIAIAAYGLLTFPGPSLEIFPVSAVNAQALGDLLGLPIQVARAVLAGLAAVGVVTILRSFHEIDREDLELKVAERTTALNEMAKHLSKALVNEERASQAKSEFLATMSHELRTPLNAIMGFSEMMRMRGTDPANGTRFKDYATHIHDSGKHLLSLIDEVLHFSTIEAGQLKLAKKPTQMSGVVRQCLDILEPAAATKSIRMTVETADHLPIPVVDERAVKQVLLNVVSNAIKFTPPKGTVKISLSATDEQIVMQVSDTGVGIEPDRLAEVTEPFTRTHDDAYQPQDGIGLGLAIVKSLVEAHLGSLAIDSLPGKGTKVTIRIPIDSESRQLPDESDATRSIA